MRGYQIALRMKYNEKASGQSSIVVRTQRLKDLDVPFIPSVPAILF